MNGKELTAALQRRDRIYGTAVLSPSPHWLPAVSSAGVDFVFIDTEHTALERQTVAWMCRAYGASGLAPLVRIPAPDPYQATMVLDGGAVAVLAPYIESPEEVRRLKGAVKFRPLKGRRLRDRLNGEGELEPELEAYLGERGSACSLFVNIESTPAIEALDEILGEKPDAVVVGPHDLSCSVGVPEQYDHPRFEEAIRTIIEKCVAHGVSMGVHAFWDNIPQQVGWAKLGANVILHSADTLLYRRALVEDLETLKKALGDEDTEAGSYTPI